MSGVDPNYDVIVIAHNGIGAQVNGKHRASQLDAIHNPQGKYCRLFVGRGLNVAVLSIFIHFVYSFVDNLYK
jgi:hypothetical protein